MRWFASICTLVLATTGLWAQPIRSAKGGPWSDPTTWDGGKVPGIGARVQVREGHRLVYFGGMEKGSCPAIVCCAGRMDFHGAPMERTWVRLGAPVKAGDATVTLAEPVPGWKAGDRIILTATTRQNKSLKTFKPSVK